jgi:hypothetical protein
VGNFRGAWLIYNYIKLFSHMRNGKNRLFLIFQNKSGILSKLLGTTTDVYITLATIGKYSLTVNNIIKIHPLNHWRYKHNHVQTLFIYLPTIT